MTGSDDRIQQLVNDVADRVRQQFQQELGGLVDQFHTYAAAERETAAREARTAGEAAASALASEAIAAERSALGERLAREVEEARESARAELLARVEVLELELAQARGGERQADLALADRLLSAVRSLDEGTSLSGILTVLTRAAQAEATGRAALLLSRGDMLTCWAHEGFGEATPAADEILIPVSEAGLLAVALRQGVASSQARGTEAHSDPVPAPFTPESPEHCGFAAAIRVDGRPVAVLYADDGGAAPRVVPSAWPEHVELLARHAGRCLEALTARQAFSPPAREVSGGDRQDEEAAERYARLLISEIKLYHEPLVEAGRREGDLRQRLRPQIERARSLYEERVPVQVRARTDYFERELVRTLAGGDAARLGKVS